MEHIELQILSGLHAGARHAITSERFTLGGGDDVDLRVLDDGFENVTLVFDRLPSGGFTVHGEGAEVVLVSAQGRRMGAGEPCYVGQFIAVGELWLSLQPRGAALAVAPAVEIEPEAADDDALNEDLPAFDDLQTAEPFAPHAPRGRDVTRLRRKAAAGLVGGTLALLVAGLGFAWMPSEAHTADVPVAKPAPVAAAPAPAPKPAVPRDQQAREFIKEQLAQAGLQDPLAARVGYGEITFSGKLGRDQVAGFDALIREVESRFGEDFRISAAIEAPAERPVFRIREVVMGRDGWVVTDAGKRVIIGGEIGAGYRLMSIEAHKIVLVGEERIEIPL